MHCLSLLFVQVYVIHAHLDNRAVACVYALMQHKTEAAYTELFTAVDSRCSTLGFLPDPVVIITDFECAAMKALKQVYGEGVTTHGCFFHLCQSTWRKIQELGLSGMYRTDTAFSEFCGMLDGLAFLPTDQVASGLAHLATIMPAAAAPLVSYFDEVYVNGKRRTAAGMRRVPALYPPAVWNVHDITVRGDDRTNNYAEGWNSGLTKMVGHKHPTVWRLLEALQADAAEAAGRIIKHALGQCSPQQHSRIRDKHRHQLQALCVQYRDGQRTMPDFLKAVGHHIRLHCED